MNARFEGRTAIVTGGSAGIGAAIAARLVRDGARVLVADLKPPAAAATGDALSFRATDVTDLDQAAAMVDEALHLFGRLDMLVNNAGIGCLGEAPELDPAVWERVMKLNVSAVFHACRAAIPAMRAGGRGGAIVNVASISGLGGDYGFGAYSASKAAAINYTRTLALDCARDGIRVNALCPGAIAGTEMGIGQHGSEADRRAWLEPIPLGRYGSAEEIANVATFLLSDEASYMTGAVLVADGGITAHTGQPNVMQQVRRRQQPPA